MATDVPIKVCKDFVQGDAFSINISHNPIVDMTGYTFELILKVHDNSDKAALSINYPVPVGADATNGIVKIPVASTDTAAVAPGEYIGSLKRISPTSETTTLLRSGKDGAEKVVCYRNIKG